MLQLCNLCLGSCALGCARGQRLEKATVTTINVPAARVQQGSLALFATAIKVRDLIQPGFYSIERLDPDDADKGFQRLLNASRARRLADYVVAGQDSRDAFLPTSVFLATDKTLQIDPATNILTIDTTAIGPFSVVDGQHRLEGLKLAAERDARVLDFEVPVNIATNLDYLAQMSHFLIVNTTQKSVDRGVEQRIIARLTAALELENVPKLPRWISRIVEKGEVDKALKLVDFLARADGSPWLQRINMPNESAGGQNIKQHSFVKFVQRYVLTANNPLISFKDFDREKKVFLNYWKAIAQELDDGDSATLYKSNSVELFCRFSIPFFTRMMDRRSFTVDAMARALRDCFELVDGEYAGVGHPEFWQTGGTAGKLNSSALSTMAHDLTTALHKTNMTADVEI